MSANVNQVDAGPEAHIAKLEARITELGSQTAEQARRIVALGNENETMYAAILEASRLDTTASVRCKVELQRIARNEAAALLARAGKDGTKWVSVP